MRFLFLSDGVHVIHQLTQAGRTLVAILLSCKTEALQHLIPPGLDALRSCVGLLRRFSGRYVCGLRSGDLMEEFCRSKHLPSRPYAKYCDTKRPSCPQLLRFHWKRQGRRRQRVVLGHLGYVPFEKRLLLHLGLPAPTLIHSTVAPKAILLNSSQNHPKTDLRFRRVIR